MLIHIFSSYLFSKILKSFNINAHFTILSNYVFSQDDKELIDDYLKVKPLILNTNNIENKKFILVDHNDVKNTGEVLFSLDHHIDCKKINNCYSSEYTSTLLYVYDLFKDIYNLSENDKLLVALSVICDSEYYNGILTLEYDYILSSSVLIIKDILSKHKKVDTSV